MKRFFLPRVYLPDRTLSSFMDGHDVLAKILELRWANNDHNISCIPEGIYIVDWQPPKETRPYEYFRYRDVPNRKGILIHRGIIPSNSKGCQLAGSRWANLETDHPILEDSTKKLLWMTQNLPKTFEVEIFKKSI